MNVENSDPDEGILFDALSDFHRRNTNSQRTPHAVPKFEIQSDERTLVGERKSPSPIETSPPPHDPTAITGGGGSGGSGGGGPPQGFTISANPTAISTPRETTSGSVIVSIQRGSGFASSVVLEKTSGPSYVNITFDGNPAGGWAIGESNPKRIQFVCTPGPAGVFPIVLTGRTITGPLVTASTTVTLTIT